MDVGEWLAVGGCLAAIAWVSGYFLVLERRGVPRQDERGRERAPPRRVRAG